jgi:Wadjet anti plasmid transformation system JetA-like protein
VSAAPACLEALRNLLSSRAVTALPGGRVRLNLIHADELVRRQGDAGLDALLYGALGRAPRDPGAEETALRTALLAALGALSPRTRSPAARSWIAARTDETAFGRGELVAIARAEGLDAASAEAGALLVGIDAVLENRAPLRLANFAARVLGRSKALLPGSDRLRRLCEALYEHDPDTRRDVDLDYPGEPTSLREAHFRALEVHGVTRDEGALSVLLFGPLVYEKEGVRFEQVAWHAALGDVCRLTLQQLRGATVVELPVARVTILENRTTFLDYVDALAAQPAVPRELVIASDGQASWAAVTLLRLVRQAANLPVRHAGDLDRSGVLILRSLARRAGVAIAPLAMDVATHARFAHRGLPLSAEEAERLRSLLAGDDPGLPAHDLLLEIARTGRWIEQESFALEAIVPGEHRAPG